MTTNLMSRRAEMLVNTESFEQFIEYFDIIHSHVRRAPDASAIADFTVYPREMPLPGLVDALQRWSVPQHAKWFSYQRSEPNAQRVVAESLERLLGIPFEAEDIAMTTGAIAAIAVVLQLVADPGDEIIYSLPPWFAYETISLAAGLVPVKVHIDQETFDLDLDAIAAAITPRTRIVLVNTPHNPTGRVIPLATWTRLAAILDEASERNGRRIYLLSDEPYNRIIFDGVEYHSPLQVYPYSFLAYSYSKLLLAPGQRIGYLAMPPTMPRRDRERLRAAMTAIQINHGYLFPNAVLQHAIEDLEELGLDLEDLRQKRDHMVDALRGIGYQVHRPEGTFFLFPQSPIPDDRAFAMKLLEQNVAVLPGVLFETPGYFRICLTVSDEVIEHGLSGFSRAIQKASTVT